MVLQNCLKFSYNGLERYIICDFGSSFECIMALVTERFQISADYATAIKISSELGYIMEKDIFEYFILLFPNPELVFHVRLDFSKIRRNFNKVSIGSFEAVNEQRTPCGYSNLNNKRARDIEDDDDYNGICAAVPVYRQNCFLGHIPFNAFSSQSRTELELTCEVSAKRIRLMKPEEPPKVFVTSAAALKRSIRI